MTRLMSIEGRMTPELLAFLCGKQPEFKALIDHVLFAALQGSETNAFSPTFAGLMQAVQVTPFYTNEWPAVGDKWWLA